MSPQSSLRCVRRLRGCQGRNCFVELTRPSRARIVSLAYFPATIAGERGPPRAMATRTQLRAKLLPFPCHGGARRGAGRKRRSPRSRVSHRARSRLAARHPVMVTVRLRSGLPSLRRAGEFTVVRYRFELAADRFGARLVHYTVQSNHLHLIVEAQDERALARAMKGVLVRIARGLNKLWRRRGPIFDDHYHARILKTPREVRNAPVYVLQNARKHGARLAGVDPFSSGAAFEGWKDRVRGTIAASASSLARARSWVLCVGWRRHGLIAVTETPADGRTRAGVPRRRHGDGRERVLDQRQRGAAHSTRRRR